MRALWLREGGSALDHYREDGSAPAAETMDPGRFGYGDRRQPDPGPGEVLVAVDACGLNHLEVWAALSGRRDAATEGRIPGSDVAGRVAQAGPGVELTVAGLAPGAPVLVYPLLSCGACPACQRGEEHLCPTYRTLGVEVDGGLAEFVRVPLANLLPLPPGLSPVAAASLPIGLMTAQRMLKLARVQPGETVLVTAAASGVGTYQQQLAAHCGARVLGLSRAPGKLARLDLLNLGLSAGIQWAPGWQDQVMALTGGRGVDVVLDSLGGDPLTACLDVLAIGGRAVTCGATAGNRTAVHVGRMLARNTALHGSSMGSRSDLAAALDLVAAGAVRPVVDRLFRLEEAAAAISYLAQGQPVGKVVVAVRQAE